MKTQNLLWVSLLVFLMSVLSRAEVSEFGDAMSKAVLAQKNLDEFWKQTALAWEAAQTKEEREAIVELEIVTVNRIVRDPDALMDLLERMESAHPDLATPKFYRAELFRQVGRERDAKSEATRAHAQRY